MISQPMQTSPPLARISYAQNMEDILLDRVFQGQKGTFVDVGANHPFQDSNTYFFYLRDWRGVNIEPAPSCWELFERFRREDLNLNLAISDIEGELPFYEIEGAEGLTGLSTLEAEVAAHHQSNGFSVRNARVPVRTLGALIEEHQIAAPDLLSIDVEHHEAQVIRSIPLARWQPRVIVVEATVPLSSEDSHHTWEPILVAHGYLFAAFNGVNRFYLREDLRDRLGCFETPVNALDLYLRHDTYYYATYSEQQRCELAAARFRFQDERNGWAWAQDVARHAQAVWELERSEFQKQYAEFQKGYENIQKAYEHFQEDRALWISAQAQHAGERQAFDEERQAFDEERRAFRRTEAAWEEQRLFYQRSLEEAQRQLRPYRLLDRLGVVGAGYRWARRLKPRRAS